jgi:hypothetical protein
MCLSTRALEDDFLYPVYMFCLQLPKKLNWRARSPYLISKACPRLHWLLFKHVIWPKDTTSQMSSFLKGFDNISMHVCGMKLPGVVASRQRALRWCHEQPPYQTVIPISFIREEVIRDNKKGAQLTQPHAKSSVRTILTTGRVALAIWPFDAGKEIMIRQASAIEMKSGLVETRKGGRMWLREGVCSVVGTGEIPGVATPPISALADLGKVIGRPQSWIQQVKIKLGASRSYCFFTEKSTSSETCWREDVPGNARPQTPP